MAEDRATHILVGNLPNGQTQTVTWYESGRCSVSTDRAEFRNGFIVTIFGEFTYVNPAPPIPTNAKRINHTPETNPPAIPIRDTADVNEMHAARQNEEL